MNQNDFVDFVRFCTEAVHQIDERHEFLKTKAERYKRQSRVERAELLLARGLLLDIWKLVVHYRGSYAEFAHVVLQDWGCSEAVDENDYEDDSHANICRTDYWDSYNT